MLKRHFLLVPIRVQAPSGGGSQIQQCTNGTTGFLPRSQLKYLPEQHQNDHHRRRFKVHRDRPIVLAERLGEQAWHQRRQHTEQPGRAGADGNQSEHVEIERAQRAPATQEEGPATPEHHRRTEYQLQPVGRLRRDQLVQTE